ncbi:MAG: peptidylprolyl isomerase, partial [Chloroflexota bacterium]|nr:peptidylprolyl isomerase [Chloroflexota bacterium]
MKQLFRLFFLLTILIICVAAIGCDIITGFEEGSFSKSSAGGETPAETQTESKESGTQSSQLPTPGSSGELLKEIPKPQTNQKRYPAPPPMTISRDGTYSAYVRTNKGDMTIALFASDAPVTVNNFVFLSNEGFYNGVRFHRIMKEFMIQTGDPRGDGTGGPGYRFEDEPISRAYNKGTL